MLILKTIVDFGSSPPGMLYSEYAANLQENIHVLQHGCSLVYFCIFSGYLFLRTPLEGCFCRLVHFKLSHHCSKLFFLFKSLDDFALVIEKTHNIPFHGTNDCFILPDGCSSILGFLNFIAAISFKFVVSTFSLSSNDLSNYSLI